MNGLGVARRFAVAVIGVLAIALLVLLLLPDSLPSARSVKGQEAVWTLPVQVRVESDLAISTINQRRLWGAPPGQIGAAVPVAVEEPPLTPPDWRITGVFTEGARYAVLLSIDGQPQPQLLHVGDHLPGGAKILAISNERLSLSLNNRRVSLSTYPQ